MSILNRATAWMLVATSALVAYPSNKLVVSTALADEATSTHVAQRQKPLSPDDVSILFSAPRLTKEFNKLIAIRDLTVADPKDTTKRIPLWSDDAFNQFLAIAGSPMAHVPNAGAQIALPKEAQTKDNWFVVGIRIDPGAPGLTPEIIGQFGQQPQIRLIVQPVIPKPNGTVLVLDTAAHLIFGFNAGVEAPAQPGCFPRPKADMAAFTAALSDFAAIRTKLEGGKLGGKVIKTSGLPLGVHPGLKDHQTGPAVRDEIKAVLERHLSPQQLGSMAIMALPADALEPWMFLSMLGVGPGVAPHLPNGGFIPVRSPALDGQQFTQALSALPDLRPVPAPAPNNLNPITCQHAAATPPLAVAGRKGLATASLFNTPAPSTARKKAVINLVANPSRSHFFNTDCVSCHTETQRAMTLLNVESIPGLDRKVMPQSDWNVRNFGWFPSAPAAQETATRRTAAETQAVLQFIVANKLLK